MAKMKKILTLALVLCMCVSLFAVQAFADGTTITDDTTWNDGDVIGPVTIADGVTITVKGTVNVNGTITPKGTVTFNGEDDAKLIRDSGFTGRMFYAEGATLSFNNITLDGGAVWTGDVDAILNRGTTNSGVKATGSVLYLVRANATLNNSTLQNHDDVSGELANAVCLSYYSTIAFNSSVVRNNSSVSGYYSGGVITVTRGGTVETNDAEVYGNYGVQGGFFGVSSTKSYGGIVKVADSKFHNNYADSGAVFDMQCNSKIGYLEIDGCEFYNNASNRGLIYEHAYSRPVIIKDSYFHDNECAVWDCHTAPVLDLSGKIVVTEDTDYTKYLFETPIGVGGALADGTVLPLSDASYAQLMNGKKHLMTEVPTDNYYNPTSKYTIVASDMDKMTWNNPDSLVLIKADVDGNAMLDVVPATADTTTNVNLFENFKGSTTKATQAVSNVVKNIPVAPWFHEGFYFTGWAESASGAAKYSNADNAATYAEGTELYATWKLQTPELKIARADSSDPYCNTLKVTVTNENPDNDITYTYQWYKGDVAIDGATSAEYTITETATYKCVVTASAAGFESVSASKSGDYTYKEAPKVYVAEIVETGVKYETLAEAVADANDLGTATIKMLKNVDQDAPLTITGKNITITGEYTIYRDAKAVVTSTDADNTGTSFAPGSEAYYWDMFTVEAGAQLTLDGKLTLDGNNNWVLGEYNAESDGYSPTGEAGKPRAGGGAYMIQNNGTLNVLNATIQNQFGNHDYGKGFSGAINVGNDSVTTLDGATIKHIASNDGGTAVFMQNGSNAVLNIKGNTLITDVYGRDNASIIRAYGSDTINMSGGTISNCYCDYGGSVIYFYSNCTMNFSGGTIANNWANGNGVLYMHSGSTVNMTNGTISGNTSYTSAIYVRSSATKIAISGGNILDNVATYNAYAEKDYNDFYTSTSNTNYEITGGIYTQDVDKWCAPGYVCIPYDDTERTDDYIVVPGYKVSYYSVDGTNAETGEIETTLLNEEIIPIPADKNADEVDLYATEWYAEDAENKLAITKWYIEPAMENAWSFDKEVTQNVNLYGEWERTTYTVSYVSEGKTLATYTVDLDDPIPQYTGETPTKAAEAYTIYNFVGWELDMDTAGTLDLVFNAKFNKYEIPKEDIENNTSETYTVTYRYSPDGDTPKNAPALPATATYKAGETVTVAPTPADPKGYSFSGWNTSVLEEGNKMPAHDVVIVGEWYIDIDDNHNTPLGPIPEVFSDDHYAYVVGYPDGTVRPTANITRAEVATIFFRLLDDEVRDQFMTAENQFTDVTADAWYNTAISTMAAMGIVNGYEDGSFKPNAPITRAEFATIAARFDLDATDEGNPFNDVAGHWAESDICKAANNGWVNGYEDGSFQPNKLINRAEAMTLINRVLHRLPGSEADLLEGMTQWSDNANPEAWYYIAVQEATNSHNYIRETEDSVYETWIELIENRDWTELQP